MEQKSFWFAHSQIWTEKKQNTWGPSGATVTSTQTQLHENGSFEYPGYHQNWHALRLSQNFYMPNFCCTWKPECQGLLWLCSPPFFWNITLNILMEFYLQLRFRVMEISLMGTYHEPHKLCEFYKWLSGSKSVAWRASHHPWVPVWEMVWGAPKKLCGELWQLIPEKVLTNKK